MPTDKLKENTPKNYSNFVLVVGLVCILATLLIQLPEWLLDLLLACSISLSLAVMIITLSSRETTELSTFPSLLLFVTLFRLSLNVSSTRLILLNGSAGNIIQTFGDFVAGGSFAVGVVIFLILVVIQFIVITKGSERISEVTARFTLDALPGKQMAIDADLNAGMITEKEANDRREKIVKESEFYGAMDGASKFIRGDVKAGLLITLINLIGGIVMGYSKGMTVGTAIKTYSILSIGDGLVSQIPSVIISISSGFLITKISSKNSVSEDMQFQFLKRSQPLTIAATVMAAMALVPGMPKLPFLVLSGGTFFAASKLKKQEIEVPKKEKKESKSTTSEKEPVETLLDIDRVSVSVGVRLISLVDPRKNNPDNAGGTIFDRIGALRRRFAQELGIIVPLVRIRDDISLDANTYEIKLQGHTVATGKLHPEMYLAMDSGAVTRKCKGIETTEPVYGLPALWVTAMDKDTADVNGYTVIDSESVFITHLSETFKQHAAELLTREDVQTLVERLRNVQPSLVGDVVGELIPLGILQRVLRNLLSEGVPIRDMTTILESLGEHASKTKNPVILTEIVRKSLNRTITNIHKDVNGQIPAITLDASLEHMLVNSVQQQGDEITLAVTSDVVMDLTNKIAQAWRNAMDLGKDKTVLICDARLRAPFAGTLKRSVPHLSVLAYDEIAIGSDVEPVDVIKGIEHSETVEEESETPMVAQPG